MDWRTMSIERLREYSARKKALLLIPEQIEALEMNFENVKIATVDETAVKSGNAKKDDVMINNIAMREELKRNLEMAKKEVDIVEKGLAELTDEQQSVLLRFFISRTRGHVESLCEELTLEKSAVYKIKNEALKRFTMACYGVVEV